MEEDKEENKETWTPLNTAWGKKKEKYTVYWLKKKEEKPEHLWTLFVDILFWLVEKKWTFVQEKKSLFGFKGDIRIFFFCFILWKKKSNTLLINILRSLF